MEQELRKYDKRMINRLKSIQFDSNLLQEMLQHYDFPAIPNQRAGAWYLDSDVSCYFKSTDGHYGNWDFSLKRMNLHLLDIIDKHGGLIIIDATRKGKLFPDALSKTIPIWCCVLNTFMDEKWSILHTCPSLVSKNEHHQIQLLIPKFVQKLVSIDAKIKQLKKPLRPIWIHPMSRAFVLLQQNEKMWPDLDELAFTPIVCISCSPPNIPNHVQGAADDDELWARGLTGEIYRKHLANRNLDYLTVEELDKLLITWKLQVPTKSCYSWIGNYNFAIGNYEASKEQEFETIVNCGAPSYKTTKNYIYLDIHCGKKGQSDFYEQIPIFLEKIKPFMSTRILLHCVNGIDRAVGIAIVYILEFFRPRPVVKKTVVEALLEVQRYHSKALPSRALLKKVNLYFMDSKFVSKSKVDS